MTKIVKGPDPLPGKALTNHTWKGIRGEHEVLWLGSTHTLFWHRPTGRFQVYAYDPKAPVESDPYLEPPTTQGSWSKKGITEGHRLLYLGNVHRRMLEWRPTGPGTSHYRLWLCEPTAKNIDPLVGNPRAEGDWSKDRGEGTRFVYLGGDLVLTWTPNEPNATWLYNVYQLNKDPGPKGDPLVFRANGSWNHIGSDHELHYLGNDRMLVWRPKDGHYRVYRVDRTVKNWSVLLPEPVLAEGHWETIKDDPDRHRLALQPGGGGRLIDWVPATGRVRVWAVKNDIPELPEDTAVPGVQLRRRGEQVVLLVKIDQLVPGNAPPTIAGLADTLRLSPADVFNDLMGLPENEHAVQALWKDAFGALKYPGHAVAARRLRVENTRTRIFQPAGTRVVYKTDTPYEGWGFARDLAPLTLRLSPAFKDVLKDAAARRALEKRIAALAPTFESFKKHVDEIELLTQRLDLRNKFFLSLTEDGLKDQAILSVLEVVLGLMLSIPKDPKGFEDGERRKVEELKARLDRLKTEHFKATIEDPPWASAEKAQRDQAADALLKLLVEPAIVAEARQFGDNLDIAPSSLRRHVYDTLQAAYTVLLHTPKADHVAAAHIEPVLEALAGEFDGAGLPKTGNPGFDDELTKSIKAGPKLDALDNVLAKLAKPASVVTPTVGNMPGPWSLTCCLAQLCASRLVARSIGSTTLAGRSAAILFKLVARATFIPKTDQAKAIQLAKAGRLGELRKLDWTKNLQNGTAWAAALGLVNLVSLLLAVRTEDKDTLKGWATILSSAAGTSAAAAQFALSFQRFAALSVSARVSVVGNRLGFIGAVAAGVASAVVVRDELGAKDEVGAFLGGVGVASSLASAAGFLVVAGASSSAPAPPLGVALMAVGAILGLSAAILGMVRDITTAKTHGVFEAGLDLYVRDGSKPEHKGMSAYARASKARPALEKAYEAVQDLHHPGSTGFMEHIRPYPLPAPASDDDKVDGILTLYDGGLRSAATIAACVDLSEHEVAVHLIESGRRLED